MGSPDDRGAESPYHVACPARARTPAPVLQTLIRTVHGERHVKSTLPMKFVRAILLLVPLVAGISSAAETPGNPVGIDFSFAGFQGGGHAIPHIPAKVSARPT